MQVMIEQADVFIKRGTAFFPGSSLAGNGLLVSDGDEWRRQRRLANPAFRKSAVDAYSTAMVTATQAMLSAQWSKGTGWFMVWLKLGVLSVNRQRCVIVWRL